MDVPIPPEMSRDINAGRLIFYRCVKSALGQDDSVAADPHHGSVNEVSATGTQYVAHVDFHHTLTGYAIDV